MMALPNNVVPQIQIQQSGCQTTQTQQHSVQWRSDPVIWMFLGILQQLITWHNQNQGQELTVLSF